MTLPYSGRCKERSFFCISKGLLRYGDKHFFQIIGLDDIGTWHNHMKGKTNDGRGKHLSRLIWLWNYSAKSRHRKVTT